MYIVVVGPFGYFIEDAGYLLAGGGEAGVSKAFTVKLTFFKIGSGIWYRICAFFADGDIARFTIVVAVFVVLFCLGFLFGFFITSSGFLVLTLVLASIDDVIKVLPAMILPSPITVSPPSTVELE